MRQTLKLTGVGFLALVLGALIYVVVRPEGSSYLNHVLSFRIPTLAHVPFINNLPSFFHVFSFSLLTFAVLEKRKYLVLSCLAWLVVNILFELGQHAFVRQFLTHRFVLPQSLESYFQRGTFDVLDIAFSSVGALATYFVVELQKQKGDR